MRELHFNLYPALFFVEFAAIMAAHPGQAALTVFYVIPLVVSLVLSYRKLHHGASFDAEKLKNGAALFGVVLFLPALISGHFFGGLLTMMAWLIIALNIGLQTRRELYFLLAGSFILFLYGTSINVESSFLFWIVLYTLSVLMVLVHDNFNKILSNATYQKVQESKQTAFFLTGLILTLSTLIYLLVPRPDAVNIGFLPAGGHHFYKDSGWKEASSNVPGKASDDGNGASDVNKNEGDEKKPHTSNRQAVPPPSNNPSMDLEPPEDTPSKEELVFVMKGEHPQYLRGYVFDYFDGKKWILRDNSLEMLKLKQQFIEFGNVQKPLQQYSITVKQKLRGDAIIYVPVNTKKLDFPGDIIARNTYGTLMASRTLELESFYTASIAPKWVKKHPVNTQLTMIDKSRYLQLPKNFAPAIKQLALDLKKTSSELDTAMAIERHFRENFKYSLTPLQNGSDDKALEHFIFTSKYGHCEYFATSMVLMLRSIGIPSRIVSGYSATTYNPVTGFYEVRRVDGHAWVEAYVDTHGWVSFEPTSAYELPVEKLEKPMSAMLKEYLERLEEIQQHKKEMTLWQQAQYVLVELFTYINDAVHYIGEIIKSGSSMLISFMLNIGVYILFSFFGLYTIWYHTRVPFWQRLAEQKLKRLNGSQKLLPEAYKILHNYFLKIDIAKYNAETLQEYTARLSHLHPQKSESIGRFFSALHFYSYDNNYAPNDLSKLLEDAVDLSRLTARQLPYTTHLYQLYRKLIG